MDLSHSPVDELAQLRRKITELRVRESMLEAAFLQTRETGVFHGYRANVRIVRSLQDVFDITKLPAQIVDDPQFQSTRVITSVRIEPRLDAPLDLVRTPLQDAPATARHQEAIDHRHDTKRPLISART
ncbi:hypothetical protein [Celeribacter marinus]|uniref:Uncharacterized protein n=1 Tax=Celeribacter marinus TaxID=1397108 RepID=A0A0P0AD09_9RHOB|nr:hypothetical protein [Celeribacter marinus]ALI56324.1 hypothetical protein IMCC12053_2377 [Celeribacter marinus]SFK46079.1 hypothetical protein SAMN05444421_104228 [Celeribacter marinus]